eukprot:scaffold53857_cov36-Phaeocystis_antarctica.AAC.1
MPPHISQVLFRNPDPSSKALALTLTLTLTLTPTLTLTLTLTRCEELLFRNPLPASLEAEATELLPQLLLRASSKELLLSARGGGG